MALLPTIPGVYGLPKSAAAPSLVSVRDTVSVGYSSNVPYNIGFVPEVGMTLMLFEWGSINVPISAISMQGVVWTKLAGINVASGNACNTGIWMGKVVSPSTNMITITGGVGMCITSWRGLKTAQTTVFQATDVTTGSLTIYNPSTVFAVYQARVVSGGLSGPSTPGWRFIRDNIPYDARFTIAYMPRAVQNPVTCTITGATDHSALCIAAVS